jgi:acetyltransferase-like isoleucine patch superfamily enzyme
LHRLNIGTQGVITKVSFKYVKNVWQRFWMSFDPFGPFGKYTCFLASMLSQGYKARVQLAQYHQKGYVSASATIDHTDLQTGRHVFIGDRVTIFQKNDSSINMGHDVQLYGDIIIESGDGGHLRIGDGVHIQPHCFLMAYVGSIEIGQHVEVAPNCAFYPYNHGTRATEPIRYQPCETRGGIRVGDDAWLGYGVVVLDGVSIGKGAVIGAGAVVTSDIPDNAIACGVPARVVSVR